jgi:hypothetical protein
MPNDELVDHADGARARLEALRPAVEAGVPWPLAERFDHAPEASWGPQEVLAHLAEMVGFWDGELARIVAHGGGEPVPFGRVSTDAARLAVIERDRTLPPGQLFDLMWSRLDVFLDHWSSWSSEARDRVGLHPRLGEVTVAAGAERFIASHLVDHADQLESSLGVSQTHD